MQFILYVHQRAAVLRGQSFPDPVGRSPPRLRVLLFVCSEGAKQKATIAKLKHFETNLVNGVKKGQFRIVDGDLVRGGSFESSRLRDLSKFTNNYFTQNLPSFGNAKTTEELTEILRNAAK